MAAAAGAEEDEENRRSLSALVQGKWPMDCLFTGILFGLLLPFVQFTGKLFRLSCVSRVRSSLFGGTGVALVSITSIQAVELGTHLKPERFQRVSDTDDLVMPAIFGMIAFKMLGGKFCSLLPSDLRYPGAFAKASLPANGRGYAGELTRNVMRALFKQFGCHHCGRKTGKSISDHIPPNFMVHGNTKYLRSFRAVKSQRFYPQCEICIKLQSSALKHGHDPLVLHWNRGWPEPCYFAGFILGALHFTSETRLALPPSSMLEESTNSDDISGSSLVQLRPEQTTEAIKKMIVKDGPNYITAMEEEMASLRTREREIYGMLQTNSASKCESSSWRKRPSDGLGMKDHDSRAELTIKKLHSELDSISLRKVHLKEDIKWLKQNLR